MALELVLLGFGNIKQFKILIFVLLLIAYLTTLIGNTIIISLITTSSSLHSPMYFFLCNLSVCEMLLTTIIMPNMLYIVWWNKGSMSLYGCITQLHLGASAAIAEGLLLTIMAYDRYLAICNPLRYSSIMNIRTCHHLAVWAWLFGFMLIIVSTTEICNLRFCGLNTIDYLFCDLAPILQLSSTDTTLVKIESVLITIIVSLLPFMLIILSYMSIFWTILKMSSKSGRQKTFSTCSSHLASVCTYFGTIFLIYLIPPQQNSLKLNKFFSLLYIIVTPLLNPIIYSMRNQEIKSCFKSKFFSNK